MKSGLKLSSYIIPLLLSSWEVLAATPGKQWNVAVGANGNFAYDPPFINAAVGDTVLFTFHPKNHSVTQSAFAAPCVPIEGGFDTAFNNPVASEDVNPKPTYQITVNDMNPIWVFCRQTGHCGKGMVFAVNPPSSGDHTFEAFKELAMKLNGTDSSTPPPAASGSGSNTPPPSNSGSSGWSSLPPEPWQSATATLSNSQTTYITTYTSYIGSPSPSYNPTGPIDHKIIVGFNGTLTFNPAKLQAAIGDTVTFEFHPKNHTATFSKSFDEPCTPKDPSNGGWDSGFMFVDPSATTFPTATIRINDTAPIWGYCRQPGPPNHCQSGMVFAINSVEDTQYNYDTFQAGAMAQANLAAGNGNGDNGGGKPSGSGRAVGEMTMLGWIMTVLAGVAGIATL